MSLFDADPHTYEQQARKLVAAIRSPGASAWLARFQDRFDVFRWVADLEPKLAVLQDAIDRLDDASTRLDAELGDDPPHIAAAEGWLQRFAARVERAVQRKHPLGPTLRHLYRTGPRTDLTVEAALTGMHRVLNRLKKNPADWPGLVDDAFLDEGRGIETALRRESDEMEAALLVRVEATELAEAAALPVEEALRAFQAERNVVEADHGPLRGLKLAVLARAAGRRGLPQPDEDDDGEDVQVGPALPAAPAAAPRPATPPST